VEEDQPNARAGQAEGEPAGTGQSEQSGGTQSDQQNGTSTTGSRSANSDQKGAQSQSDNPKNQTASKGHPDGHRPGTAAQQGSALVGEGSPSTSENTDDSRNRDQSQDEKSSKEKRDAKKKRSGGSGAGGVKSQKGSSKRGGSRGSGTAPRTPSAPRPNWVPRLSWLPTLLKWIFYGFLLWLAWRYRRELMEMFRNAWQQFLDLWHNLFGGWTKRQAPAAEAPAPLKPPRRFADFTDPFAAGVAEQYPPGEIVRYTFEALEAWASDHGCPRQPEQTPHEFTRCLASHVSSLTAPTRRLADLYCQVAYAPDTLPMKRVRRLSHLWQALRARAAAAPPVSHG
jgi:hypothetical protein